MSILLLNEAELRRAHDVALHASRPEHWYRPGVSTWTPGDRPEHVVQFASFRAVFSFTVSDGALWRHLSISSANAQRGKLPVPLVACTVASWFGFTGGKELAEPGERPPPPNFCRLVAAPGEDWLLNIHHGPILCLVLAQRIGPEGSSP